MADDSRVGPDVGAGCGRTARFIREEILTRFTAPALSELEDAAVVELNGAQVAISTDSYIVDPPIFPGGDIGRLAVCGTVNDLVASGATPRFLTFGLVMAEGTSWIEVRTTLDSAAAAAREAGVTIVAGDTKVVQESRALRLCINTTGIGTLVHAGRSYALRNAQPGDAIILTGTIGDHSLAVLSVREGLGFESRVQSDCAPLASMILPLLERHAEVRALRDVTRGGLRGVLCDLADNACVDLEIDLDAVPIQDEVRAGCAMLGLDPIDMVNEGKMIVVVEASRLDDVLKSLRGHRQGRASAVIGQVNERVDEWPLVRAHHFGVSPVILTRFEGQPIPRLC